jgi:2-polyprenyl-3-methyl-5-hydroxy-6-metoxy-1,4-benzoquinol methylase
MLNLAKRSYTKELLDNDNIPFEDIKQNMKELNKINTYLGGHHITIAGLKKIINHKTNNQPITICEIGCGGGDNLKAIETWCKKNSIVATFIGIDLKATCIAFAKEQYPLMNAVWIVSDYRSVNFANYKPDIIFSSLFCHHFTEEELQFMLLWMRQHSLKGFFINDLHRHPLAYYSIKLITTLFSKSYLVKNDAPLSVARGFTKNEWTNILTNAALTSFSINWKWAFRHLIICNK